MRVFIDSNIPMDVAGRDHPLREPVPAVPRPRAGRARSRAAPAPRFSRRSSTDTSGCADLELAVEVYDLFVGLCANVFPVTLADSDRARDLVRRWHRRPASGASFTQR